MTNLEILQRAKDYVDKLANGNAIGITTELRHGVYGDYTVVLYDRCAQQFLIDNIDSVIGSMYKQ